MSTIFSFNRHRTSLTILRYAIRESSSRVRLFKSFKEKNVAVRIGYAAEGIFGGALLGVRSSGFLCFYDWETGSCVRRVDIVAKNVCFIEGIQKG
jgi:coatomer subunit beta'